MFCEMYVIRMKKLAIKNLKLYLDGNFIKNKGINIELCIVDSDSIFTEDG